MQGKHKVLFVCTGNACRSQMAEGWARRLHGDAIEPSSAGIVASGLDPRAVEVMAEAGVDISFQVSELVDKYANEEFDLVATVCDYAAGQCPVFKGARKVIHNPFDDPPMMVWDDQSGEEPLQVYRRVRDEIRAFVEDLPQYLVEREEK